MWRQEKERLRFVEHLAPGRLRRLRAEPEIAKTSLGEDRERELDGHLHDDEPGDVGENVLARDCEGPTARGACREYEIPRPDLQCRAARYARENRNVENADGNDGIDGAWAKQGRDHHRREDDRKGKGHVREAHHNLVDPAPPRGRERPQRHAEPKSDRNGDHRHRNGVTCTSNQQ